jgi:hypothetical protein
MFFRSHAVAVVGLLAAAACGPGEPRTDAERLARGKEIVERVSAKLGSAQAFTVTTREVRERVKADGSSQPVNLVRQTAVRRPDRLHFKTSGDAQNEGWYDGIGLTFAIHNEKVFAQARMPETLDRALDAINERYDVPMPLSDFLYTSPAKALIASSTTGGWVGRETVGGRQADHLSFRDKGTEWELWVPVEGDPLPLKFVARFPDSKRLRKAESLFSDWNLAPDIPPDRFKPTVGPDYEGIAMLQRESILRHVPEGEAPADAPAKK